MLFKTIAKKIFVVFICFLVSACVTNKPDREPLSDKKNAALHLKMGVRYMEMNMLSTAKDNLEKALDLDSDDAKIHNALGALYERLKQYEIAGEHYQNAINLKTDNISIKNNYGRFLCDRGDYESGIELLNQALEMPFNNRKWYTYTNIGRCELQQGHQKIAEGNFRQALQAKNNYSPALFEMQRISYRTKKYMSARAFLERYLGTAKHNAETLWYAVQTERSLGNKKKADKYRSMLFKKFPASKEAQQLKID
jgi:type IV pilus assembly protein PilF